MERVTCQQGSCWHDWDAIGRDDCKPEGDSTSGTIIWDDGWLIRITRRNLHLWGWTRTTSIESRQFWETTPPILDGTNSGSYSVGKSSGSHIYPFFAASVFNCGCSPRIPCFLTRGQSTVQFWTQKPTMRWGLSVDDICSAKLGMLENEAGEIPGQLSLIFWVKSTPLLSGCYCTHWCFVFGRQSDSTRYRNGRDRQNGIHPSKEIPKSVSRISTVQASLTFQGVAGSELDDPNTMGCSPNMALP